MKALVVNCSLSGTTRALAEAIARELGADIEEIGCPRYRPSIMGVLRAPVDSWRKLEPPVEPSTRHLASYDLVLVGGPVWAFRPAAPVCTFLHEERKRLLRVAFFLTHGGSAPEKVLLEMDRTAGQAPRATLVVRQQQVKDRSFTALIPPFVVKLREVEAKAA